MAYIDQSIAVVLPQNDAYNVITFIDITTRNKIIVLQVLILIQLFVRFFPAFMQKKTVAPLRRIPYDQQSGLK